MFGKKKTTGIPVQHYEGISAFAQDYPCRLEIKGDILEIKRIKPETTVNLPMNRIVQIDEMEETQFMAKYHGSPVSTAKSGKKYFLVITYTNQNGSEAFLAFWGTSFERGSFIDMKSNFQSRSSTINL